MSMPFYVAPEQVMKDRADYARKGIARGRSLVAVVYDDGILICAENPSNTLRKVSEIYDRIAFAGVGKYNEFDQLRIAGVRAADLKGYSVQPRGRRRPQPGQPVRPDPRPDLHPRDEADGGRDPRRRGRARSRGDDQMFHILYDGTVMDEHELQRARRRGRRRSPQRLEAAWRDDLDLGDGLPIAASALWPAPTARSPPTISRSPCSPHATAAAPSAASRRRRRAARPCCRRRRSSAATDRRAEPVTDAATADAARPRRSDQQHDDERDAETARRRARPSAAAGELTRRPRTTDSTSSVEQRAPRARLVASSASHEHVDRAHRVAGRRPRPASSQTMPSAPRRAAMMRGLESGRPTVTSRTIASASGTAVERYLSRGLPVAVPSRWSGASSASRTSTASRARSAGQRRLSPDEVARYLFRRVVSWGRSSQRVPRQRRPAVPRRRLATPSTPRPSATRSTTSSCTTRRASASSSSSCASAEQRLREEGIRGVIYLFKNNTDSAGNSYGCHENYLTSRRDDFAHYAEVLIPFFVSRQIYAGAGKVLQTARGRDVLHQPAGRAHLGGRVVGHHPQPARSSTPATSPTPTPSATAGST